MRTWWRDVRVRAYVCAVPKGKCAGLLMMMMAWAASAATLYVDCANELPGDGTNWNEAFADLREALIQAESGDTVRVAQGIYRPTGDGDRHAAFTVPDGVTLVGGFRGWETEADQRDWARHPTILSGDIGSSHALEESSALILAVEPGPKGTVLDGLVFEFAWAGGASGAAAGLRLAGSSPADPCLFAVRRCTFRDLHGGGFGGAVYARYAEGTFEGCCFLENEVLGAAGSGGGIYALACSLTLENCVFADCTARGSGGAVRSYGVLRPGAPALRLVNCTLVDNTPAQAAVSVQSAAASLVNTIVWGHSGAVPLSGPITVSHSCIQTENPPPNGAWITADPQFVDAAARNLRLAPGSPCIDAGDNSAISPNSVTDAGGITRTLDAPAVTDTGAGMAPVVDIGAYEFDPRLHTPKNTIRYVNARTGSDANDGTSWHDAFATVQAAVDTSQCGDSVWVAEGTYLPTARAAGADERQRSFLPRSGVAMYGGFPDTGAPDWDARDWVHNPTVLSGNLGAEDTAADNAYHVVRFLDKGEENRIDNRTVLDGFVISGGNADGPAPHDRGAGILCDVAAPAIRNCLITGNLAVQGAGLTAEGASPDLDDVVLQSVFFHRNRALSSGGAATVSAPARIWYSVFVDNSAGRNGGAISIVTTDTSQTVQLRHCTVVGNRAPSGGAVAANTHAAVDVNRCVLWNNEACNGTAVARESGSGILLVSESCFPTGAIDGNWSDGGGSSSENPCFRCPAMPAGPDGRLGTADDGLALTTASPWIDRSPALPDDAHTDALGRHIEENQWRDAGAYEGGSGVVEVVFSAGPNGSIRGQTVQTVALGEATSPVQAVASPGYCFTRWSGNRTEYAPTLVLRPLCAGLAATAHFGAAGGILYVDADAVGDNTGRSWTNAFTDLQAALRTAGSGEEIWVAEGTYAPGRNRTPDDDGQPTAFSLPPGARVYGGFTGSENRREQRDWRRNTTTLAASGPDSDGCVLRNIVEPGNSAVGRDTVLDGFTITNADAGRHDVSAVVNDNASPTIRNCVLTNNRAPSGAAIHNRRNANPLIVACEFRSNHAPAGWGGAIYTAADAGARCERCVFSRNHAAAGGALTTLGAAMVRNCLFVDNDTDSGGGADQFWRLARSSEVTNCTFAGGLTGTRLAVSYSPVTIANCLLSGASTDIATEGDGCTVSHCNLGQVRPGEDNSQIPPQFADSSLPEGPDGRFGTSDDGYSLIPGSPGADNADPCLAPVHDLKGDLRPMGDGPDRGAYESGNQQQQTELVAVEPPSVSTIPTDGETYEFQCTGGVWQDSRGKAVNPLHSYQWQALIDPEAQVVDTIAGQTGTVCSLPYHSDVQWLRVRVEARLHDGCRSTAAASWSAWHPAGTIELPIRIGAAGQSVIVAGLHPQATAEFDPGFDRTAAMRDESLCAAFFTGVTDPQSGLPVTTDVRPCRLPVTWTVAIRDEAPGNLTLHWEPIRFAARLPPGVGLSIQSFASGLAAGRPVDMLRKPELNVLPGQQLRIVLSTPAKLSCRLEKGWNLVGVPVAVDADWDDLFERADGTSAVEGPVWISAGNGYSPIHTSETVTPGLGCWVFTPDAPFEFTLCGLRLPRDDTDTAAPGSWHLAAPRTVCPSSSIATDTGSLWAWDARRQRYRRTATAEYLSPGSAYWCFDAPSR